MALSGRILPWLTLIPTIFTFIAVILTNIGSVDPSSTLSPKGALLREKNSDFPLVHWNYTLLTFPESGTSTSSYSYTICLNRICYGSESNSAGRVYTYCSNTRNSGRGIVRDGRALSSPNGLIQRASPFRFSDVNLNAPFAFYLLTAIMAVALLVMGLIVPSQGRIGRLIGVGVSAVGFLFILIASAIVTWQMLRVRRQIRDDTLSSIGINSSILGSPAGSTTTVQITIRSTSLGTTVLALTWSAVFAMLLEVVPFWLVVQRNRRPI